MEITWAGGHHTRAQVTRPVACLTQLSYYPQLATRARELAGSGCTAAQIAARLNAEGFRPPKRIPAFTPNAVSDRLRALGIQRSRTPARRNRPALDQHEWWLRDLAAHLGMSEVTLDAWARRGWADGYLHPRARLRVVRADPAEVERLRGHGVLAAGTLYGSDDDDRACFLSGQDGLVAEVLPSHVLQDGRISPGYWWGDPGDPHWRPSRVPGDADIDVVGRILLGTGPSWNGLCVAARSVAAWERIAGSHERILDGRTPRVVAAAVDRLIAYRAGGRGTFADAAAVYRIDEAAVRSADRAVRPVLALAPGRPW